MTIRFKAGMIVFALSIAFTVGIFVFSKSFLLENINFEEKRLIYQDIEQTLQTIEQEKHSLETSTLDWSGWDDTYYYVTGNYPNYVKDNLMDDTFKTLNINIVAILDLSGELVYARGFDYQNNIVLEVHKELEKLLSTNSSYLISHNSFTSTKSGLVYFMSKPVLLASAPIYKSDRTSPIVGTLVMGRFAGEPIIKTPKNAMDSAVSISLMRAIDYSSYMPFYYQKYQGHNSMKIYTRVINDNTAEGIACLEDIFGNDTFLIQIQIYRIFYVEAIRNLKWFLSTFLCALLIINFSALSMIQRFFISRIERINDFVNNIKITRNTSLRLEMKGKDELSNFANGFNLMLDTIDDAYRMVAESEERFRLIMNASNDGFWDVRLSPYEAYISQRLMAMLEFDNTDQAMGSDILLRMLQLKGFELVEHGFQGILRGELDFYKNEHRVTTAKGNIKWLFIRGKVVERDKYGKPMRLSGIVTDITETKQIQEEVEYLSFNDSLTGLFNRAYFITKLDKIDKNGQLPLSIIMGDVNGLKLTNDAFGHNEGDRLLMAIAEILKKACRKTDIIARLGGDEFVILLPSTNEAEAMEICTRIKTFCEESEYRPIQPSIALGIVTKTDPNEKIDKLYEIAEERMYKNKLLESRSARHSIIALMEKTLYEMDYETEAHTERMGNLAYKMGQFLNLSSSDLDELQLLAKLHDIGKTAIPREILTKPESLNDKEWSIMRQHTEIGYRMAMATPDLAPIAESILSHHERWDGRGYPRGIKGEEIPLLARIIAIVDAYDVITNSRPYKKALSHETAIAELKRCAGTYFDANLVKIFVQLFEHGI